VFFYIFVSTNEEKHMRNFYVLFLSLVVASTAFAQKKEKLKGSKTVTVAQKEIGAFENLELEDNLEIFLVKGNTQSLEIEADDNLHEAIMAEVSGSTLRIYTSKDISGAKRLSVRVTYTDALKNITAKHEVVLNAISDLELPNAVVKTIDYAKAFLNVKSPNFSLIMDNKSKAEMNIKSENVIVELSKNAELKALIASPSVKIDMYQKTTAEIEGDAAFAKIRLDNNATFIGKKFTVKNMDLVAEGYTNSSIMAAENISIFAAGKTEIQLLGSPKIDLKNFSDNATLYKKLQ
jgi:hypothetical protein